jgi:hypothetical protein
MEQPCILLLNHSPHRHFSHLREGSQIQIQVKR